MLRKSCFKCHGLGVNWTKTKLLRYLQPIKDKRARFKAYDMLRDKKNEAHCKLCKGTGVLIYP